MNNLAASLNTSLSSLVFTDAMQQQVLRKIHTRQTAAATATAPRRWHYTALAFATCLLLVAVFFKPVMAYLQGEGDPVNTPPTSAHENVTFLPLEVTAEPTLRPTDAPTLLPTDTPSSPATSLPVNFTASKVTSLPPTS